MNDEQKKVLRRKYPSLLYKHAVPPKTLKKAHPEQESKGKNIISLTDVKRSSKYTYLTANKYGQLHIPNLLSLQRVRRYKKKTSKNEM